MKLKREIFRQYDIRGIVDQDLTQETVEILGKGIGTYFRQHGRSNVAVGMDCRLSSPPFFKSLSTGLLSTGCNVTDLGTIPTPLLYFAIFYKKMDSGVMITGSHNPPEYNGFKLMSGEETLYGPDIQDIYRIIEEGTFIQEKPGLKNTLDIVPEYSDFVVDNIKLDKPLKVVVDAGNGTGGVVAVPIFKRLGCDVIDLFCEMDGHFPNHEADPTVAVMEAVWVWPSKLGEGVYLASTTPLEVKPELGTTVPAVVEKTTYVPSAARSPSWSRTVAVRSTS